MNSPAQNSVAIGIDVGGTKIAGGLVAFPEGRPISNRTIPTEPTRGGAAVLTDVRNLARQLCEEAKTQRHSVTAIGLGICELVNREGKIVSANCIEWMNQPVQEELSAIAPTTIEADVRAAAVAEAQFGAGKPFQTFLYVTIGTGISCCLILEGKPYVGAHGATGTMASSSLSVPCGECGHKNRHSLEDLAAGPALVSRFNALGGAVTGAQEVLSAAMAGSSEANEVIRSGAEALGSQIGLLVNVLDPEAVVVGGGLGLSEGLYFEHFIASTQRHIWSNVNRDIPILRAALGADAGWIGAATKAWQELQRR